MFGFTSLSDMSTSIFKAFEDFGDNLLKGIDSTFSGFRTDIVDKGDRFILSAELPGFNKEDISIEIDSNLLTISAKRTEERLEKDDNGNYIKRERSYGTYKRSFDMTNVKVELIKADYKNGILELSMPKIEPGPSKQLKINIS